MKCMLAIIPILCAVAQAAPKMPAAQQNEVFQRYCGVCHDDAQMQGGLTVQHFDAANPNPPSPQC